GVGLSDQGRRGIWIRGNSCLSDLQCLVLVILHDRDDGQEAGGVRVIRRELQGARDVPASVVGAPHSEEQMGTIGVEARVRNIRRNALDATERSEEIALEI